MSNPVPTTDTSKKQHDSKVWRADYDALRAAAAKPLKRHDATITDANSQSSKTFDGPHGKPQAYEPGRSDGAVVEASPSNVSNIAV